MARRRINKSVMTQAEFREKQHQRCLNGKHSWRPLNYKYAINAKCEGCGLIAKTKSLSDNKKYIVKSIAKTLRETQKKVNTLHPIKSFNKDGY